MNPSPWRAMARKTTRWVFSLWLVLAGAGLVRAQEPVAAVPERAPWIRRIEEGRDDPARKRIEVLRRKLPGKYQRRNNFAWAVARIDGLEKEEYFAHSGIQSLAKLSSAAAEEIQGISLRRKNGRFQILCVNHDDVVEGDDCWPRHVDTEYKIMEDLASRLPDPAAAGRVRLYTDLYPCASCRHVMGQFLTSYTNVQMQVLYRER